MILPVYIYGQPVLRKEAEDITPDYPNLKQLLENMFETMYAANGVGLAAPQINLSIRLVVIDAEPFKEAYPEAEGFKKVFNSYILLIAFLYNMLYHMYVPERYINFFHFPSF